MPALSGAILKTAPGEGMLDLQTDWQCPDPDGRVTFRIEQVQGSPSEKG
jgi:uncharacterized repeat protein (TIGR04076 family)